MIERVIQLFGADDKWARPLPDRWWRTGVMLSVALTAMALVAIPIIPRPDAGTAVPFGGSVAIAVLLGATLIGRRRWPQPNSTSRPTELTRGATGKTTPGNPGQ